MTRKNVLDLLLESVLWGFAAIHCGSSGSRTTGELAGNFRKPLSRVVSLVPSATEIVYALKAEGSLVGNCNQCDYPEAARAVPKVGDFAHPDLERIVALRPQMVLLALPIHRLTAERLTELGTAYMVCNPQSVEAVFQEIESIAVLLGRGEGGRSLVDSLRKCLPAAAGFSDTPSVYVEISSVPLMSVGGCTYLNDLIRLAGGRNVFEDINREYFAVSPEDIASRNPDVIIVLHPSVRPEEVSRRLGWAGITAVKEGRVHGGLDEDLLLRPGPRLVEGARLLHGLLHPEQEGAR